MLPAPWMNKDERTEERRRADRLRSAKHDLKVLEDRRAELLAQIAAEEAALQP